MTSSRLDTRFDTLRRGGRGGLVAYVTAGDPDRARFGAVPGRGDPRGG